MKNEFPPGINKSMIDPIEFRNGVYDLLMPPEFNISPIMRPNILICIELTPLFVSKGTHPLIRILCTCYSERSGMS